MSKPVLLMDLGNSNLKYASFETGQGLGPVQTVAGDGLSLQAHLRNLQPSADLQQVWLASVAGEDPEQLIADWCQDKQLPLQQVSPMAQINDLVIAYQQAGQLGVDRWLAMLALRQLTKQPFFVISCGTAVTLDLVDQSGQHVGGLIIPGIDLMLNALQKYTANIQIERNSLQDAGKLGTDTTSCVYSGALQAVTGMVEKQYRTYLGQYTVTPEVYLTGGNAELVRSQLSLDAVLMPDLVLHGLAALVRQDLTA